MSFLDKTFCASPNCVNECGRKMSPEETEYLQALKIQGREWDCMVSMAYFCDHPTNTPHFK